MDREQGAECFNDNLIQFVITFVSAPRVNPLLLPSLSQWDHQALALHTFFLGDCYSQIFPYLTCINFLSEAGSFVHLTEMFFIHEVIWSRFLFLKHNTIEILENYAARDFAIFLSSQRLYCPFNFTVYS